MILDETRERFLVAIAEQVAGRRGSPRCTSSRRSGRAAWRAASP